MTFNEFKNNVELWAAERGIYEHSSTEAQLMKALSELGELADAIIKGDDEALKDAVGDVAVCIVNAAHLADVRMDEIGEAVAEFETLAKHAPDNVSGRLVGCASTAIGESLISTSFDLDEAIDVVSSLTSIAVIRDLDFMECCEHAWNEIKDRKGRMVAGGAFVKDEEEQKQDGGPAFPQGKGVGEAWVPEGGMTLRDYFAAKAMQGVISNFNGNVGVGNDETNSGISACAYAIADAMLKERNK